MYQGEEEKASDNICLGIIDLTEIPRGLEGYQDIEITFNVDANGILDVEAKEKDSGKFYWHGCTLSVDSILTKLIPCIRMHIKRVYKASILPRR